MRPALSQLTIEGLQKGLKRKDFSVTDIAKAYLEAIAQSDLNAFLHVRPEETLKLAKACDERLSKGIIGPLEGVPLAIKDNIAVKGWPLTAASKMLKNFVPPYESFVTQKLWEAGAFLIGKVNMDEFAMGSSNMTSHWGAVKNPWRSPQQPDVDLVPGGSSGGSAAAVAGHLALGALGTDTGGSIRQPAAFCGLVGLKPTYGRCSRWGVIAFASSLDQAGPLTKTVRDSALILEAMAGHDPRDSTSSSKPVPQFAQALGASIKGLRVGVLKDSLDHPLDPDVEKWVSRGVNWLKDSGAILQEVKLPHMRYALATYAIIAGAEAASNLARFDGVRYGMRAQVKGLHELYTQTRDEGFGPEVKRRILVGTYALSQGSYDAYFGQAQRVKRLLVNDFETVFKDVDVVAMPTAPTAAFPIGKEPDDPTEMYLNDIFTVTVNMAGLPGISVPIGLNAQGLPLGFQLVGRAFAEETLLKTAHVIEQAADFEKYRHHALKGGG